MSTVAESASQVASRLATPVKKVRIIKPGFYAPYRDAVLQFTTAEGVVHLSISRADAALLAKGLRA